MKAQLRREGYEANLQPYLASLGKLDHFALEHTTSALENGGIAVEEPLPEVLLDLARAGFVEFACDGGTVTLTPVREDFRLPAPSASPNGTGRWKASKFLSVTVEGADLVARSPLADSKVRIHDPKVLTVLHSLANHSPAEDALAAAGLGNRCAETVAALAHALLILPCDDRGRTVDETEPHRRQWDAHDLAFHAQSRLGRSGVQVGATWSYRGEIPEPPSIRDNPWGGPAIPLYRPAMLSRDLSLFEAMETRRSIRQYSAYPLTAAELGEFLFRTMRIRSRMPMPDGSEYLSRPYPNGGGIYEQELYVTVDACTDLARGVYYYDALHHALSPVAGPGPDMEGLIAEAAGATGHTGHPQILFTIASRFDRFNWKYSGMAYAAQLKNVGVIYQTMYLVATAMGLGGCALGLGNSDRFARITGRDWLEEGSIGEFMIGRPA